MPVALTAAERRSLERLLGQHEPADGAERQHLARIAEFVERQANPFDRELVEGHLTGSAFVRDPRARLLLTHHRRLDIWVQLGGHAEGEREAPAVALREAQEESGLTDLTFQADLLFDDGSPRLLGVDVHEIPAHAGEPRHEHLDLRFLLTTEQPEEIRAIPSESRALEWVSLEEARRRCDRGVLRELARLRTLRA